MEEELFTLTPPSPLKGEGTYKVTFPVGRGRSGKWAFMGGKADETDATKVK
jgi:hypothetical protein